MNDHAGAEEVREVIERLGRRVVFQADVGVKSEVDAMLTAGIKALGKIGAGEQGPHCFLKLFLDEANLDRTLQTNLKSVFLCSQAVACYLVELIPPGSIAARFPSTAAAVPALLPCALLRLEARNRRIMQGDGHRTGTFPHPCQFRAPGT